MAGFGSGGSGFESQSWPIKSYLMTAFRKCSNKSGLDSRTAGPPDKWPGVPWEQVLAQGPRKDCQSGRLCATACIVHKVIGDTGHTGMTCEEHTTYLHHSVRARRRAVGPALPGVWRISSPTRGGK